MIVLLRGTIMVPRRGTIMVPQRGTIMVPQRGTIMVPRRGTIMQGLFFSPLIMVSLLCAPMVSLLCACMQGLFFSPSFAFFIPHPAIVTAEWKDGFSFWRHNQIDLFEDVFLCNLFSLFCINEKFIKKMIIHFFQIYERDSSRDSLIVARSLIVRVC